MASAPTTTPSAVAAAVPKRIASSGGKPQIYAECAAP